MLWPKLHDCLSVHSVPLSTAAAKDCAAAVVLAYFLHRHFNPPECRKLPAGAAVLLLLIAWFPLDESYRALPLRV
jgi:hypothetical protein